jgi:hypothetical protein
MPTVDGKVEIELVPASGVWTDISARVVSVDIAHPRTGPFIDTTTTGVTVSIRNHPASSAELTAWGAAVGAAGFSPFTPDSPAAAFYPNLTRDRRVRVSAVVNGVTTYVRFLGWADRWVPESAGTLGSAQVTLSASCVLSRYARRSVLSVGGEAVIQSVGADYWPFDDAPNSTLLHGYSLDPVPPADGVMVAPSRPPGGGRERGARTG